MRHVIIALAAGLALAAPSAAQAQGGQVQGFGGLSFGDVTNSQTFGGGFAVPLGGNLQIIAEGGRIHDVMPSLAGTIVDLTPFDAHVSAWYGEAGLRVIGSANRVVRPYAEATAGFARLMPGFTGSGSRADAIANTALRFLDTTEPMLGVGGGVILQGGPAFVDIGYRYKKITAGDSWRSFLVGGGDVSVNQVRVGVGVRF
jgi:opacity protein-like surface antigen